MEKKISELDFNEALSSNDLIVIVDSESNSTKKSYLGNAVEAGLPQNIEANISIRSKTNSELSELILPIGELAYETDTNCLRIGDGSSNGGLIPNVSFYKINNNCPPESCPPRSTTEVSADDILSIEINNMEGLFNVKASCFFTGSNPPKTTILLNENGICASPGIIKVQRLSINSSDNYTTLAGYLTVMDERKSLICPNEAVFSSNFDYWTYYESSQEVYGYFVEIECNVIIGNLSALISVGWASAIDGMEVSHPSGHIVVSKIG